MFDTSYRPMRHDPCPRRPGGRARVVRCGAPAGPPAAAPAKAGLPSAAGALLATWYRRWRDRCELRWMAEYHPDDLLADIGLSREDLWREARKPFWRR